MATNVKWGVIGSGGIARRRTIPEGFVPAANADLVAVFDVNPEVNAEVAAETGAAAADSLESLLGADLDAVYIATPAALHREHVLAAAAAGKHVLCEKPLGMTVAEAEEMITACEQAGVTLGAAFMMRFHSQHQAALQMVREGKLGTLTYGRAQLSCWYPPMQGAWRQDPLQGGGGSLIDMGGHCIDLLEMYFGEVKRVSCVTGNIVHDYVSEDGAVTILTFKSGAIASVDSFFCISDTGSKNMLELYGTRGSILAQNTIGQGDAGEMTAFVDESEAGYEAVQSRATAGSIPIAPEPRNTYRAEIEAFSQAVLDGEAPSISAGRGLQSQKLVAACYESAKTGRAVDL